MSLCTRAFAESPTLVKRSSSMSCQSPGQIVISFDQGPSDNLISILQEFNKYNVKATVHVLANDFLDDASLVVAVKQAYLDGHLVGLQVPLSISNSSALNDTFIIQELQADSNTLFGIFGRYPMYLRLSGPDARVETLAAQQGYVVSSSYNLDATDSNLSLSSYLNVYNATLSSSPSQTSSFIARNFDTQAVFTNNAAQIVSGLNIIFKTHGYVSVTLDVCLSQAQAYRATNYDNRPGFAPTTTKVAPAATGNRYAIGGSGGGSSGGSNVNIPVVGPVLATQTTTPIGSCGASNWRGSWQLCTFIGVLMVAFVA